MNNLKLAPVVEAVKDLGDNEFGASTVEILTYCLRDHCTEAEYLLAKRTQELREIALELVIEIFEDGGDVPARILQVIEVTRDIVTQETISL